MKKFVFLLCFLWSIGAATASNVASIKFIEVENSKEWNAVFEQAKSEGKLVFVDVYTDWCGYCKKLDKEVYTNPDLIDYFEANFINVKFDAETEFGYGKASEFAIDGYPTLLFLTDEEQVFEQIGGFVPVPTLMAYAENVQGSWSSLPELKVAYESGTITKEEQLTYIGILEKRNYEEAAEIAKTYIATLRPEDYQRIETLWLVSRFENQLSSAPFQYITANKLLIIEAHGRSEFEDYMKAVYNDNLELAIRYGALDLLNELITHVLPEFTPVNDQAEMAYITKSMYYGQREEFENYIFENNAYINNHLISADKRDWLIREALEIINNFQSEQLYEHALDLLQQSISIDDQNFQAQALAGYACGLLSDFNNANAYLNTAERLASGSEEKEIIEGLKQAVKAMQG